VKEYQGHIIHHNLFMENVYILLCGNVYFWFIY